MIIAILGTGYVGLVTGTCLANMGHTVHCIDINSNIIDNLNKGIIPIYEPGLEELVVKNKHAEKLFFTTEYDIIEQCDAVFCCVGTPSTEDGHANLKNVFEVAKEFGKHIRKHSVFIDKSTVPIGTAERVKKYIELELSARDEEIEFDVISNPEFLKEGSAVEDFNNPDRIIIGCDSEYAELIMTSIYKSFPTEKLVFTNIKTAEMIKYAANSMLATRISFINELANLCDKVGANIKTVSYAIGLDSRIGHSFLNAGCGYGGSCFPKDIKSLIKTGEDNGMEMNIIKATEKTNNMQKHMLYNKLYNGAGKVEYPIKNIAILGVSFKPNTDDTREAPAIALINDLLNDDLKLGPFEKIKIYDPIALKSIKKVIGETNEKLIYCEELDTALIDADAIIIITEWNQIKNMNLEIVKKLMKGNLIIDGRNVFDRDKIEDLGFIYEAIGC